MGQKMFSKVYLKSYFVVARGYRLVIILTKQVLWVFDKFFKIFQIEHDQVPNFSSFMSR